VAEVVVRPEVDELIVSTVVQQRHLAYPVHAASGDQHPADRQRHADDGLFSGLRAERLGLHEGLSR
jgi:hypothetical protein